MSVEAKIKEIRVVEARKFAMRSWKKRFAALKKQGMTLTQFAEKYKFNITHLSHQYNGRRGASKEYFDRVEKLLAKLGV